MKPIFYSAISIAAWLLVLPTTVQGAERTTATAAEKTPKERSANTSDRMLRDIVAEKFPEGNVYIGATSTFTATKGPVGKILARQFSYITPANDFKQSYVHPEPNKWKWDNPDGWVKFAEKHNQVIRIHGPISPQTRSALKKTPKVPSDRRLRDIVAEKFSTELPVPLEHGKNIMFYDSVDHCVEICKDLLRNTEKVTLLSKNARIYYEKHVHPAQNVKRILDFMINDKKN